jgi:hypothetical protein
LEVLLAYGIECLTSAYAVEEARRNLARHFPSQVGALEAFLPKIGLVDLLVAKLEITMKSKDIPILFAAVAGRATHLLTNDVADFSEVMKRPYKGLKVLTPKMMAQELKKQGIL